MKQNNDLKVVKSKKIAGPKYYNAEELHELIGISMSHSYRIIQTLNKELRAKGFITFDGKVPIKYCNERLNL